MASGRRQYPFHLIEPKWQKRWDEQQAFRAFNPGEEIPANHPFAARHGLAGKKPSAAELPPKFYILDMFPYPSGAGLHVGHPEGYTATDILARYKRACGLHVLHPMGWDAFGLPAEQYAVRTGQHPRQTTEANIATFKRQIQSLGFSYDWSRELATTDPDYFKWTQWIFLKLYNSWFNPETNRAEPIETLSYPPELEDSAAYGVGQASRLSQTSKRSSEEDGDRRDACPTALESARRAWRDKHRLAYVTDAPVWWCPALGTVLANEEVIDGKSEVGGHPVTRKPMRQWMLRITAYAERLLQDLDTIDWSDSLKEMQRNWIGRSEGAEVDFGVAERAAGILPADQTSQSCQQDAGSTLPKLRVFTTRPDTLFGATYMVLSPEHRLVDQIIPASWPEGVPAEWINGAHATQTTSTQNTKEIAAKAAHFGAEVVNLSKLEIPIEVVAQIPGHLARKHNVIPVNSAAANLTVAVSDPSDLTAIDDLRQSLKRDLMLVVAAASDIEAAIQKYYRPSPREVIAEYRAYAAGKSDLERTELAKEKTGVFTGAYAINPVNGEKIPIWIADYVLASYGTGAIMAVPAHDERDFEFAKKFKLQIKPVVGSFEPFPSLSFDASVGYQLPRRKEQSVQLNGEDVWIFTSLDDCFLGEGVAVNSANSEMSLNDLPTPEAKKKITDWLEAKGLGKRTINYKLRDWLFSRQRYWGEPFPVVWKRDASGNLYHEALPESALPVLPPPLDDYKPTPEGQPPLARAKDWVSLPDGSQRETNTMPQWAGSCWYYLRYLDAKNATAFVGKEAEQYWMGADASPKSNVQSLNSDSRLQTQDSGLKSTTPGVDLYVGGTEHAVLHLLYARFWHKVLYDLGYVSTPEPFFKLVNQGLILGEDGQKMSKARGNVVNPDDMVNEFGADALRLYEMFMGPLEMVKPWSTKGVEGVYRFLGRVWRLFVDENSETEFEQAETLAAENAEKRKELLSLIKLDARIKDTPPTPAQLKTLHACIKKVTEDLDGLRFNTAISALMVFVNDAMTWETKPAAVLRAFLQLLAPFAPHLAEELWAKFNSSFVIRHSSLPYEPWPKHDSALLVEDTLEIPVQVNGKLRDVIRVPANIDNATLEAAAKASEKVKPFVDGKTIKKIIIVPKKLVNIVVA